MQHRHREAVSPDDGPLRAGVRRFMRSFWGQLLLAFLVYGLVLSFVAKPYTVPSGSMQGTLQPSDRVLVNRLAYRWAEPAGGDVIVFEASTSWDTTTQADSSPLKGIWHWVGQWTGFGASGPHTLIKRAIATPGQSASCCSTNGEVIVDGHPVSEPYVSNDFAFVPGTLDCTTSPRSSRCFDPVTVPVDSYLVLGDNRSGSSDSAWRCRVTTGTAPPACWRWATRAGLVGRADAIFWPANRWQTLPTPPR